MRGAKQGAMVVLCTLPRPRSSLTFQLSLTFRPSLSFRLTLSFRLSILFCLPLSFRLSLSFRISLSFRPQGEISVVPAQTVIRRSDNFFRTPIPACPGKMKSGWSGRLRDPHQIGSKKFAADRQAGKPVSPGDGACPGISAQGGYAAPVSCLGLHLSPVFFGRPCLLFSSWQKISPCGTLQGFVYTATRLLHRNTLR